MEEQIYEKKNNRKNNNTGILLVTTILLSLVCSMLGAYIVVSNTAVESVVKNITESSLVETSISSSVDKVYDKTVKDIDNKITESGLTSLKKYIEELK